MEGEGEITWWGEKESKKADLSEQRYFVKREGPFPFLPQGRRETDRHTHAQMDKYINETSRG